MLRESVMFISVCDLKITQIFSSFTSNTLHLVSTTKTEVIPPLVENRQSWSTCKPFFIGLSYCTTVAYSNASSTDSSSYYPLTGDSRSEMSQCPHPAHAYLLPYGNRAGPRKNAVCCRCHVTSLRNLHRPLII